MPTITTKRILKSVGLIYDSACDPASDGWIQAYRSISRLISSGPGSIHIVDKAARRHVCLACTHGAGFFDDINSIYYEMLPYREQLEQLGVGELFNRKIDCPDDVFLDTELYQEHFKRLGFYQILFQRLHDKREFSVGLAFSRPKRMPDFSEQEFGALSLLTPHLERGVELWLARGQKHNEFHLLDQAMAAADEAVILATRNGRVEFINPAGERMIGESELIALDASHRLGVTAMQEDRELRRLILSVFDVPAGSVQGGTLVLHSPADGISYRINVSPHIADSPIPGIGRRKARISIKRESRGVVEAFGLTPAESRLAALLCDGLSIRDAAENLSVSQNTVRTHLKRIFSKTDTHRQSSLVRLLVAGDLPAGHASARENKLRKIPYLGDDLSVNKTDTCR